MSQLATWGKDVINKKALQLADGESDANITDLKFFLGRSENVDQPQRKPCFFEVFLDCPDGYGERKEKMLAIFKWAFEHGYDYVWKIDDDVYLRPERLLTIPPHDYCGLIVDMRYVIETEGGKQMVAQIRTALGGIYGLSRRSLECLLAKNAALPVFDHFEDGWVCEQLRSFGILPTRLNERIGYTHIKGNGGQWKGRDADMVVKEPPTPNNNVVASFEYNEVQMLEIHSAFNGRDVWATTSPWLTGGGKGA
jgi:hypothetical protein